MHDTPSPNSPVPASPAARSGGKLVVAAVLVLGVLLAGFGLWYHYAATRRSLEFWGPEAAGLISRAPQVEVFRVEPATGQATGNATIAVADQFYRLTDGRDISESKGLIHARAALVTDSSFSWNAASDCTPRWSHALRFSDGSRSATVLFAWECPMTVLAGKSATASLAPLGDAMQVFCREQYQAAPTEKRVP